MRSFRWALFILFALMSGACADPSDPWIEKIVPERAAVGATVDIVGERFAGEARSVSFGAVSAAVLFASASRIRVHVPSGVEGLTIVVVMVDGRPSNAFDFTVTRGAGGAP